MSVVDILSDAPASALSNFIQIADGFIRIAGVVFSIGATCAIAVRSTWPRMISIVRRFPGSGKRRARRHALRRLARIRLFQRQPRLLALHIGQQISALLIVEGGRMLFRAMSTSDRVRALGAERPRNDVAYEIAFDGLLLLVLSTALILVAMDSAVRLREWADGEAIRRKLIERYHRDHGREVALSIPVEESTEKL